MKILCKPSTVRLESQDSAWSGNVLFFGKFDFDGSKPVLNLRVRNQTLSVPLKSISKTGPVSRFRIEMAPENELVGETATGFVIADGIRVGLIESLVFPKE